MERYLITGGAGFIGSNIAASLIKQNKKVRIIDDLSTGKIENILAFKHKIEFIEDSICNRSAIQEAVKGVDYILHQAAIPSVQRSVEDPLLTNYVNVIGTLELLNAAKQNNIRCVVIASSSSVYGDTPQLPKREDFLPLPLSPYAVSKVTIEHYAQVFSNLYGLNVVCLRYFNVFGPRQDPSSEYAAVIPAFITALLTERRPKIFGDGNQSRDFCFVENVVQANLLACSASGLSGKIINIGSGQTITINQLFSELKSLLNSKIEPIYAPPRKGDIRHSLADITKARTILKYNPQINLKQGLKYTIEWFKHKLK
jgi:nucleoside-diphosphate-sugar epimerase